MIKKTDYCVFIGRFQPVHIAHVKVIEEALETSNEVIIVIGSYRSPRSLKNPWTYEERVEMLSAALEKYIDRIHFVPSRDYLYNITNWLTGVQNAVSQVVGNKSVKMIGHFKDDSSYYLKMFPQWELVTQPNYFGANSTDIREALWNPNKHTWNEVEKIIPKKVEILLSRWSSSKVAENLRKEYVFLHDYKLRWESSPFPPVFVTTDAVVVQAGHVLLVKRGRNPGKGKYALPGGFISQTQTILDSCLRELKEETKILYPKDKLRKYLKSSKVFDHPYRDLRGRTITNAFYFHIDELGPLPYVKGSDDADEAVWTPINDLTLIEEEFFSDHLHIINYFIHAVGGGSWPKEF